MSVVEFPLVRVSKALNGRRFPGSNLGPRPLGRALLVGGSPWLEAARRVILETGTKAEAAWHEACDFAQAGSFLLACRVDIVLIAPEAASGPDWEAFRDLLAAMKSRPLFLALCRETGPEVLQQLLDQGVDGVVSFGAVRLMRDELRNALSHPAPSTSCHVPLIS